MDTDDRLIELQVLWDDATARGEPPTPESLCREYPELESEFRRRLALGGAVDALLQGSRTLAPDLLAARLSAGRYRPLGFHAAGGLGVVFTAEDSEVGRTVALKCMQEWVGSDEVACRRFEQEAEVTGELEHPGIVPVYGMGRDDRDRPYYAMRFVRGATLGEAVSKFHDGESRVLNSAERTVEFRRLLRAFVTICETTAYAHSRGVVHRDIKPANILLGPYGEMLLIDWGLAKRSGAAGHPAPDPVDSPTIDGASRTLAGVAIGTPAYMSPEQALGEWDRVGAPADVFSLGATLYEILTGGPPYVSPGALDKARGWQFPAPSQIRRAVSQPLEAVCLKAMANRIEDRYGSARDLATDVERWLADEPVSAWREPFPLRTRRWVKRHRTMVTAAFASAGMATAALVAGLILLSRKNEELGKKNDELVAAHANLGESKTKIEDNLKQARVVTREMTEQAIGNPLLRRPGMAPIQHALLKSSLKYYKTIIAAQRPDDPEVQEELAFAHYAVAVIADETGKPDEALTEFQNALALCHVLRDRNQDNPRMIVITATANQRLGMLKAQRGETDAGLRHLEDAIADLDRLTKVKPDDPDVHAVQFAARLVAWEMFSKSGRSERAAELRASAESLLDKLGDPERPGLSDEIRTVLALGFNAFGAEALMTGRFVEAERHLGIAVRLCNRPPLSPEAKSFFDLVTALVNLNRVELLATRGQTKEALDLCRPIRVRFTEQATIASDFPLHHLLAGKAALAEGRVAFKGGMFESAEEPLEAARVRFLAQVEKPSPDPEAIEGLAQTCQLLGVVLREREKRQLAEERIAEAGRHFETLRKLFPKNLQYRLNLAEVHNSSGNLHLLARAEDKAEKEYERARQLVAEVLQERPDDPWVQHRLAVIGCGLGRSLIAQKKDTGLPWLEKGVTAQDELVQKYPEIVEFTASRDMDRYSLGGVLCGLAMYDTTLSVKTLENTLALHEKGRDLLRLAALAPKPQPGALEMYAGYLEGCGAIFNVRAGDHYKAKRYPEALRLFEKALSCQAEYVGLKPNDSRGQKQLIGIRILLPMACNARGEMLDPKKEADRAELLRVVTLGLAAYDALPTDIRQLPNMRLEADDLRKRLDSVRPPKK